MKLRSSLAFTAAVALCAGALVPPAAQAQKGQDCFFHRDTDSFTPVDDHTINLRVGENRYYQLELLNPCLDLDFSQSIGLRSRGSSWICTGQTNAAEIITRSAAGPQRCQVSSVRRLTPADIAAMPRKDRP